MSNDKSISLTTWGEMAEGGNDIAQSWYNILHTVPGSDPMRPTFGSAIFDYLDKPTGRFGGDFSARIIQDLEKWEPRTKIGKVKRIIGDASVAVQISGTFTETGQPIEATIDLSDLATADVVEIKKAYSEAYKEEAYN